ncbi:C-C motif chemokine 20 [Centroberyx affinis]|uniref:C-C motif chemokine 20 n=1 Tax=Centroberyx affinis TaxID=166261 RepID=UPI003A5BAC56
MAPRGMVTVTTALLCCILGLLRPTPAASARMSSACCMSYTRTPVAIHFIKGYKEQTPRENCHIAAIIFYTIKNKKVCATSKDEWVRKALAQLSARLKKLSKANPTAGGAVMMRSAGSGSFFNGTNEGIISNSTETLY